MATVDAKRTAGVDVELPLQIGTADVANGQVSGPCLATSTGAVSARSTHSSEPQQTVTKGGEGSFSLAAYASYGIRFRPVKTKKPVMAGQSSAHILSTSDTLKLIDSLIDAMHGSHLVGYPPRGGPHPAVDEHTLDRTAKRGCVRIKKRQTRASRLDVPAIQRFG